MEKKMIFVRGSVSYCCHWHRMICPLRYYHKSDLYTAYVDLNMERIKGKYDYLFIHGQPAPDELAFLFYLKETGCEIVWCVDDDYFALPEDNPRKMKNNDLGALSAINRIADHTIFSTWHLLDVFEEKLGEYDCSKWYVAPNLLEPAHYRVDWEHRLRRNKPLIAWFGCPGHDDDLKLLIPLMAELEKAKDMVEVAFFGSCHPEIRSKWIGTWAKEHNGVEFPAYPDAMYGMSPDIALCPLNNDDFAKGRSDLKVKEAAAMGAYPLFSPVGPFEGFSVGQACNTTEEWIRATVALVKMYHTQRQTFMGMCNGIQSYAKDKFFWGTSPEMKTWNNVLDSVFGRDQ